MGVHKLWIWIYKRNERNWGIKIMEFGQTMDLIFITKYKVKRQKNDGYWTNYGFGSSIIWVSKEAEKSWVLNELWIWN